MSSDRSSVAPDVYAVIRTGGKQYRVSPGQHLRIERLDGDAGDRISFDVLFVSGNGVVTVGAPTVDAARVSGEIIEQGRGRKIRVFKYKNKTRYRRLRGHRQLHTAVRVDEVVLDDRVWSAPVATPLDETDETSEPTAGEQTDESSDDATAQTEAVAEAELASTDTEGVADTAIIDDDGEINNETESDAADEPSTAREE